jgi:predicted enzyme related to lactoylglutathione lyase
MATFSLAMVMSNDLAKSRDFYRDVIGLTVGVDHVPHWVDFELPGGAKFGLHPAGHGGGPVMPGSMSLGFAVDDVDAFVEAAKAKGVSVMSEPRETDFGRLAILRDPDGYPVQVVTYK